MYLLIFNIWILSIFSLFMSHPLSFGLILLLQTINISLITGMMMFNFWYSYMLFLIMIGGMLILFMYMTNVASNEKFKFSSNLIFMSMLIFFMFLMTYLYIDLMKINFNNFNILLMNMNKFFNLNISINKYLNFSSMMIYFILIMYLLITLIAVVNITNINKGPLRS
uniref:NADH-ubiquinone oxidoreductase chain 6 n=1 Tax=Cucujoidea sp. 39 KM-2017 TaxID=2219377 RepID=A0A346RHC1_9CUCU|nr:NADH dehydrogenase subunit 6 [Cucujoidea sp. 39 KM-2017]